MPEDENLITCWFVCDNRSSFFENCSSPVDTCKMVSVFAVKCNQFTRTVNILSREHTLRCRNEARIAAPPRWLTVLVDLTRSNTGYLLRFRWTSKQAKFIPFTVSPGWSLLNRIKFSVKRSWVVTCQCDLYYVRQSSVVLWKLSAIL
jgi:hypothetical protein